jgi:hypothetical protein
VIEITEGSFDRDRRRHIVLAILSRGPRAMSAWWLPAMFVGAAVLSTAVEYGGLLASVH